MKNLLCIIILLILISPAKAPPFPAGTPPLPQQINVYGNTAGNINSAGQAAIQGDWIYYCNRNDNQNLYKIKTDGSEKQKIYDVSEYLKTYSSGIYSLNVVGEWIYYTLFHGEGIYAVKTDGSENKKITDNLNRYFFVVGDLIYYVNGEFEDYYYDHENNPVEPMYDYAIYVANTDGSNPRKIVDLDWAVNFCINGDWIYYTEEQRIYAVKTDGSGKRKINDDNSEYINVIGDWIYYCNASDKGRIYAIKTDGSGRRKVNDDEFSYWINVSGDWIYYCPIISWGVPEGHIYAIKTDGSERRQINSDFCNDIEVVGDWIYYRIWNDTYKIKTDGSERERC